MTRLTKEQLISLDPCDQENRLAMFGKAKSMNAKQAFKAGFSIRNLCWVAGKLKQKEKLVKFANKCADSVSHLKNNKYAYVVSAYAAYAAADAYAAYAAYAADAADAAYAAADAADAAADAYAADAARQAHIKLCQSFFVEIFDGED